MSAGGWTYCAKRENVMILLLILPLLPTGMNLSSHDLYALTPRNYARQSIRERCLLALASFMLALIGLKKFRSFQKLNRIERGSVGLQELRRGIHASLPGSTRQDKLLF